MTRLALLAAVASAGFTVVRDPNVEQPIRWNGATAALRLHQQGSADVADGSDLAAMRAALAAWNAAAGFTFSEAALVTGPNAADDGENVVSFFESWPQASGVVALTIHYRNTGVSPQTWREADVLLNGQDFAWATDGDLHAFDVQSVVTHELGHVLGLHHAAEPTATMFFAGGAGMTYARTLSADDRAGARYLYPAGGFACAGDADCPLLVGVYGGGPVRRVCSAAACGTSGTVAYGLDCFAGADCDSGTCVDDPTGPGASDPGFCSQACGACPQGDLCEGGVCLRAREGCWDTGAAGDADCGGTGDNVVCTRDIDGRFRCNRLCVNDGHCGASPGTICWFGVSSLSPGFCLDPGPSASGTCTDAFDCESLVCTSDAAGSPVCVSSLPSPDDAALPGGDVDRGGSDTAPPPGGDTASSFHYGNRQPGEMTGGCACRVSPAAWWWLIALTWRRRPRGPGAGINPAPTFRPSNTSTRYVHRARPHLDRRIPPPVTCTALVGVGFIPAPGLGGGREALGRG